TAHWTRGRGRALRCGRRDRGSRLRPSAREAGPEGKQGMGGRALAGRGAGTERAMSRRPRAFISAFGVAGHVFPAIALGRALRGRGYEVWFESQGRWRDTVEDLGLEFVTAPDYIAFPRPWPGMPATPTLPDCARSLAPIIR